MIYLYFDIQVYHWNLTVLDGIQVFWLTVLAHHTTITNPYLSLLSLSIGSLSFANR